MGERESDSVIEVQGLMASYGDRQVLQGVDLSVRPGEIMVIMGGSGSGKSTLLRHLLGLMQASEGCVSVLGRELASVSRKELFELRRQIGVAFQGGALLNSMSLIENVELPLRHHTHLDDTTIGIMSRMKLEMMSLSGFEHSMPSELSGGMLKRASLARAVVMDPKLLFFDEPSAGLDPITSAELDELILRLRSAMNMTIVVVTHELHSALQIADRISILGEGRVLMVGTVDEVRESDDDYIQSMLNRKPRKEELDIDDYLQRLTRSQ